MGWPLLIAVLLALLLAAFAFEYRLRKPDQLVMCESDGAIRLRRGAFYPRHFSLPLAAAAHQIELATDSTARGGIQVRTALAVTVAPSLENLTNLVRVGGWQPDALARAAQAFEAVIQGAVKAATESYLIEELSAEALRARLEEQLREEAAKFGLEVVALTVQSLDPADPAIAEALRQRESARILEQTELLKQKARVAAARARIEADEQIALSEHELELKRYELKKAQLAEESALAHKRTEDELERSRMRLAFEREEMALLKNSPELLLLTPQAARLAEASQTLKNARTVVSIGASDADLGLRLSRIFQRFLDLIEGDKAAAEKKQLSEREGG